MTDNIPTFPIGGDPYVIVRGGLVVNDPALPVIDLDVLDADFRDKNDAWYARTTAIQARRLGLDAIADELETFADDIEEADDGR